MPSKKATQLQTGLRRQCELALCNIKPKSHTNLILQHWQAFWTSKLLTLRRALFNFLRLHILRQVKRAPCQVVETLRGTVASMPEPAGHNGPRYAGKASLNEASIRAMLQSFKRSGEPND